MQLGSTRTNHQSRGLVRGLGIVVVALALLITGRPVFGRVEVALTRVGFPTLGRGDVVRHGAWIPVTVDVDLIEEASFDGSLRVAQYDGDGDECFDSVGVHLRAEAGSSQRFTMYVPANAARGRGEFAVELRNEDGEVVEVVSQGELTYVVRPAQRPAVIDDDVVFILSLSSGAIGRVRDLIDVTAERPHTRLLAVGHLQPSDLPEHWIGLEAVDCIVWDDARPENLSDRQLGALVEWTRQGGTLLLTPSGDGGSLRLTSQLNDVLPVDIGDPVVAANLPEVRRKLLERPLDEERRDRRAAAREWWEEEFERPVQVLRCTAREGTTVVAADGSLGSPVVVRRRLGRGHVIFSGVRLAELFSAPARAAALFEKVFYLTKLDSNEQGIARWVSLFSNVSRLVSFAARGSFYLLIAGVSSVAYVVLATFGSWGFLSARGWRRHSWSAFAIVALVASALTVVAVRSKQGFGVTLRQVSIIDADAGTSYGYGTVLLGLKTSTDRVVDVWLPPEPAGATEPRETACFLRPLPSANDPSEITSSFADPVDYRAFPASAVLDNVRLRATLKQFGGRWSGPISGPIDGLIDIRDRQVTANSYLVNNLDVELKDCWLIHSLIDAGAQSGFRSQNMYAYSIGDLPAGGERVLLHPQCYPALTNRKALREFMQNSTLANQQMDWESGFAWLLPGMGRTRRTRPAAAIGMEEKALLLVSTGGDYNPTLNTRTSQMFIGLSSWSRDRLRGLDLRSQMQTDSAILIGFADDPGPIRLFMRSGDRPFRPVAPDAGNSKTMYRIRFPVKLSGRVRPFDPDEEDDLLDMLD